jgi:hypothetical protein
MTIFLTSLSAPSALASVRAAVIIAHIMTWGVIVAITIAIVVTDMVPSAIIIAVAVTIVVTHIVTNSIVVAVAIPVVVADIMSRAIIVAVAIAVVIHARLPWSGSFNLAGSKHPSSIHRGVHLDKAANHRSAFDISLWQHGEDDTVDCPCRAFDSFDRAIEFYLT